MVEIVSLDSIKDLSYNMDMAEEIDDANFMDQPIDIDNMRSRDEWGQTESPSKIWKSGVVLIWMN